MKLQDGSNMPNFMTSTTASDWETQFTINTSQTSNAGTYAMRFTIIATHNTNSGVTRTKTIDFTVNVSDACGSTTLTAEAIADNYALLSDYTITLPLLADSVNVASGTNDPTTSICGGQSVSVQESGSTPSYVTTGNNNDGFPTLTISANGDNSLIGVHTFDLTYSLTN